MSARAYAEALSELSSKEGASAPALVKNLVKTLEESGRLKLLPHILRELRTLEAKQRSLAPVVEVARKEDAPHALKAAKKEGIDAEHAVVNPALIGGWRARMGGKLVDASGKGNLIELYRNITR